MIDFAISTPHPHRHQLQITCTFTASADNHTIQIPFWRPGRYEAGNFPRNYIGMVASSDGEPLSLEKSTANTWLLQTRPGQTVVLNYTCNASELTAGNTFLDGSFLLINPVNCLLYPLGMEASEARLELDLPRGWTAATSFEQVSAPVGDDNLLRYMAGDVQELLDTPILASKDLHRISYEMDGVDFHIHMHGERAFDDAQLLNDFKAFTEVQLRAFGNFPVKEYHFLLIFTPFRAYHGVEHDKSTVIILGPAADLADWKLYKELLGVSSHELYHTWNVKYLRPRSWAPYDFTGPAHERLGYIAEGVTTYMGDWMLWQAGVFSDDQYFLELGAQVQKHLDNGGRKNLSLGDAAIDTWTDGYGRGAPRRRVSIYTEGALLAFVTDVWLLKESGGQKGLAHFMMDFCAHHGGADGYTEEAWWSALAKGSALNWAALKRDLVDAKDLFERYVRDALAYLGLELKFSDSQKYWERSWGASIESVAGQWQVFNLAEGGPAEQAGLWFGDEVRSIDGVEAQAFFTQTSAWPTGPVSIVVRFGGVERTVEVAGHSETYFSEVRVENITTEAPLQPFKSWKNLLSKHPEEKLN